MNKSDFRQKEASENSLNWQATRAKRQNQTATLLEVQSDDEQEKEAIVKPITPPVIAQPKMIINCKLIGINKVEQFNYFKNLLEPSLKQSWHNYSQPIKIRGILAEVNGDKIALLLADISADDGIAKVISLVILARYPQVKIASKLIQCLEKSLPKLNCDRLELNQYAEEIANKIYL